MTGQQIVSIRDLWDGRTSPVVTEKAGAFREVLRVRESLERSVTGTDSPATSEGSKNG